MIAKIISPRDRRPNGAGRRPDGRRPDGRLTLNRRRRARGIWPGRVDSAPQKILDLREIRHRVRGDLQVISSLIDLAAISLTAICQKPDPKTVDRIIIGLKSKVKAMSLAHSILYDSGLADEIEIIEYFKLQAQMLEEFHGTSETVRMTVTGPRPVLLRHQAATSLGLAVSEALSNSLCHAFAEGRKGSVIVFVDRSGVAENEVVTVTVSDDGRGLAECSSSGKGTGFRLMENIIKKQLGGRVGMKNLAEDPGGVSGFVVTFEILVGGKKI